MYDFITNIFFFLIGIGAGIYIGYEICEWNMEHLKEQFKKESE